MLLLFEDASMAKSILFTSALRLQILPCKVLWHMPPHQKS